MYKLILVTVIPEVPPKPRSVWLQSTRRSLAPSPRCGRPILAAKRGPEPEPNKNRHGNRHKHSQSHRKGRKRSIKKLSTEERERESEKERGHTLTQFAST